MTKIKNGGPAFPSHGSMVEVTYRGMSLRDWFAGQALGQLNIRISNYDGFSDYESERALAATAYSIADAMLAARDQKP